MSLEKEQREEKILLSLKKLDFLSRSQLQKLHRLGSVRNAQRVLKEMEPYVSSFREKENVYYLSKEGRERVGSEKVRKKTPHIKHYLMRNDLYMFLGCPFTWKSEVEIKLKELIIKTDACFDKNGLKHFVEVDHMQSMSENKKKINTYQEMHKINPAFRLLWLTTTDFRRKKLLELCKGLDCIVYTVQDIK